MIKKHFMNLSKLQKLHLHGSIFNSVTLRPVISPANLRCVIFSNFNCIYNTHKPYLIGSGLGYVPNFVEKLDAFIVQ